MKESVKNIIKLLVINILLLIYMYYIIPLISQNNNKKGIGIDQRTININIQDETMFFEDIIDFNIYSGDKIQYQFFSEKNYLENVKLYINNIYYKYSDYYKISDGYINIEKSQLNNLKVEDENVKIKLTYELDLNYIKRYKDTDIFPMYINLKRVDYLNNLTINLNSNYEISNLSVKNSKISKVENKYVINNFKIKKDTNIDIFLNIKTNLNNKINSDYVDPIVLQEIEDYSYISDRIYILVILAIISIILFILTLIINKKNKVNSYRRDTSGLISPILAESVIDCKIGLKELIMTTIIDLNIRGNINIINNDTLELISKDNLESYEEAIVDLLFKHKIIKINDINNIFLSSNDMAIQITKEMNLIKRFLFEKIHSMKLFSTKIDFFNKVIGLCALLISLNIPQIFIYNIIEINLFFVLLNFYFINYYIKSYLNKMTIREKIITDKRRTKMNVKMIICMTLIMIIMMFVIMKIAKYHIVFLLCTIFIFLINLYTGYRSKDLALTKKGKYEQKKLLELKKYINDFSLIKERDLKSVIIWDKYLAYATALGIPSKITSSIYENWYNLNIDLQIINNLFYF